MNNVCTIQHQKISYEVTGTGPPMIFLHGWGGSVESFYDLRKYLENDFTVYLIDFPGFGKSEEPEKFWNVDDYAQCIYDFMKQQDVYGAIVCGHSFGGRVIIKLASKYADIFSRIVLMGSAGIQPKRTLKQKLLYVVAKVGNEVLSLPGLRLLKKLARKVLYKASGSYDYLKTSGVMRHTFMKVIREDLRSYLSKISQKTLLLWGDKDMKTPLGDGKIMEQEIPDAQLIVFPGGKHNIHRTHAKAIAEKIRTFLSS